MDTLGKGTHVRVIRRESFLRMLALRFPPNTTLRQSLSPSWAWRSPFLARDGVDARLLHKPGVLAGYSATQIHNAALLAMFFASALDRSPWHPPSELASEIELYHRINPLSTVRAFTPLGLLLSL